MKNRMMDVTVKVQSADAVAFKADVLALGVFADTPCGRAAAAVNEKLGDPLGRLKRLGDFEGKTQTTALVYGDGRIAAARVLFIGLGDKSKCDAQTLRKAAAAAASQATALKARTVALLLSEHMTADAQAVGQALAEGACFGAYRYDEYIADADKNRSASLTAVILAEEGKDSAALKKGTAVGVITGEAQNAARTLANRPANVITPAALAAEAKKVAAKTRGLRCTVLDEKQLSAKKFGGILAVGQGSHNPPRLTLLHYKPAKTTAKTPKIALVGKAITFDSGGISIKPGEGMQDMKFDKSGGIAVLYAMQAIARLKPNAEVVGLIPSAENMPGGKSYRPGDIITTFSGTTVEIQNTDAEGRMILCDAIAYAKTLGCRTIVDVATLTGACVVAIGQKRAGLMGNDDGLIAQLKDASAKTGERLWHLPCDDEYVEAMKSKVADLKNTGGKWAAACTAAAFLSRFAEGVCWAHLDIAGVGVWGADDKDAPGSIGFGVRLLTAFACGGK